MNTNRIILTGTTWTPGNYDSARTIFDAFRRLTALSLDVVPRIGEEFNVKFDGVTIGGWVADVAHTVTLTPGGGRCDHAIEITLAAERPVIPVEVKVST